ncbi:MAG: CpaF family protein, partial [Shinella sp.]
MFGKRGNEGSGKSGMGQTTPAVHAAASTLTAERPVATASAAQPVYEPAPPPSAAPATQARRRTPRTEDYYDTKSQVFSALIDTIDLSQLAKLDT